MRDGSKGVTVVRLRAPMPLRCLPLVRFLRPPARWVAERAPAPPRRSHGFLIRTEKAALAGGPACVLVELISVRREQPHHVGTDRRRDSRVAGVAERVEFVGLGVLVEHGELRDQVAEAPGRRP